MLGQLRQLGVVFQRGGRLAAKEHVGEADPTVVEISDEGLGREAGEGVGRGAEEADEVRSRGFDHGMEIGGEHGDVRV
jgi:hypothetical protein